MTEMSPGGPRLPQEDLLDFAGLDLRISAPPVIQSQPPASLGANPEEGSGLPDTQPAEGFERNYAAQSGEPKPEFVPGQSRLGRESVGG